MEKKNNEKVQKEKHKLLVCVSSSPSAAKCIRWTARAAEAFHAPWTALYVEHINNRELTENEQKNAQTNIELAERLGAEIVILNGYDVASVVTEYAKLCGITNIVVGKSRNRKTLKNLFDMDLEDKLISEMPGIEVHIIPGGITPGSYRKPKRLDLKRNLFLSWSDTLKTIGVLITVTILSMILRRFEFGDQNVVMFYILSVLFISRITMGYVYGVLASALSVLTFNFFFTLPYFSFDFVQSGHYVTFIFMLIVALITSTSTFRIKTQAQLAVERERRTEVLYEINKKLLSTRGLENIVNLTNEYIIKLFDRSAIFYTKYSDKQTSSTLMQFKNDSDASFMLSDSERAVVDWVFGHQKEAGAGTDSFKGAGAFYMPILSQGNVLGVIGLSCAKERLIQNNRSFLKMIVSQVAMALERQYLSDEQQRILIESEKEKMRSNLLRAISHDLRTPLTGILGASSVILENGESLDRQTHDILVANIKEDSQWLIRMVENLLSVTRIKEGTMNVAKKPEAAEEIIAGAIRRMRKRFPKSKITARVPDELLLVPMDGTLIEQVLINLLENAIKHSPADSVIEVEVRSNGEEAVFEVMDHGEGIAEKDFPYLFESYVQNGKRSSDSSRGMGIGLSICKSIIKAHSGKMEAANQDAGGAIFWFTLPIEEDQSHA